MMAESVALFWKGLLWAVFALKAKSSGETMKTVDVDRRSPDRIPPFGAAALGVEIAVGAKSRSGGNSPIV